jgi:LCP family protein required for cell wall assembly
VGGIAVAVVLVMFVRTKNAVGARRAEKASAEAAAAQEAASEAPGSEAGSHDTNSLSGNDGEADNGYTEIHTMADFATEKWNEGRVLYDGRYYRYKDVLQNYLFMGIDNDDKVAPAADGISGGQSDAMFLMVLDETDNEIKVIAINRNTMVPVDVYDEEGNFLLQMPLQICLQHGYGDGMKLSCMRSVDTVSSLFGGIPISGYLALNIGGMPAVNDAIGGVEIIPIESVKRGDVVIKKGESVNLDGDQAYVYLRTRDVDEFASANMRLQRQEQYITAMAKKLLRDPNLANKVYNAGADYIVASIDLPKLVSSARDMHFDEENIYDIPGETEFKDEFEQYITDEDGLIRLVLDVFYEEEQ